MMAVVVMGVMGVMDGRDGHMHPPRNTQYRTVP